MKDTTNRRAIIALAVATALIHLVLSGGSDLLFILNGLGFLGLLGLIYLPLPFMTPYRVLAKWGLAAFSLITIIAYFVVNPNPLNSPLGLLTKAIELALIVLIAVDKQKT